MGALEAGAAIVTGAASAIGEAIADAFASEGARLLLADLDSERLEAATSTSARCSAPTAAT